MKYSVLVVDDDASIWEGFRRTLGQHFELYLAQGQFQGMEKIGRICCGRRPLGQFSIGANKSL